MLREVIILSIYASFTFYIPFDIIYHRNSDCGESEFQPIYNDYKWITMLVYGLDILI